VPGISDFKSAAVASWFVSCEDGEESQLIIGKKQSKGSK
jgi:hypothetical protein